jgi:hypothetical protein
MKAPLLKEGYCSLLIAEYATGHVYNKDFTLYNNNNDFASVFQIFESFDEAKKYATEMVLTKPDFEFVILDNIGEHLITFDCKGERK